MFLAVHDVLANPGFLCKLQHIHTTKVVICFCCGAQYILEKNWWLQRLHAPVKPASKPHANPA
jgi:hypothetical protein